MGWGAFIKGVALLLESLINPYKNQTENYCLELETHCRHSIPPPAPLKRRGSTDTRPTVVRHESYSNMMHPKMLRADKADIKIYYTYIHIHTWGYSIRCPLCPPYQLQMPEQHLLILPIVTPIHLIHSLLRCSNTAIWTHRLSRTIRGQLHASKRTSDGI